MAARRYHQQTSGGGDRSEHPPYFRSRSYFSFNLKMYEFCTTDKSDLMSDHDLFMSLVKRVGWTQLHRISRAAQWSL